MDFLRSGYSTDCEFFADNPATATINWYRAPAGAKPFPGPHKYGSLNWYSYPWLATGVGEVYGAPRPYNVGFTPPSAKGITYFGPLADFQAGPLFDPSLDVARDSWGLAIGCTGDNPRYLLQEYPYLPLILQENEGGILLEP